jgi:hypothetical protein
MVLRAHAPHLELVVYCIFLPNSLGSLEIGLENLVLGLEDLEIGLESSDWNPVRTGMLIANSVSWEDQYL